MKLQKQILIPVILFLAILVVGWYVLQYTIDQDNQKLSIKTQVTAEQVGIRLHEFLNTRISRLGFLRERMESEPFVQEAEFRSKALLLQHELPGFQAVNWIDTAGIIQWVTPLSANLPVVGVDLRMRGAKGASESFSRALLYQIDTATEPIELIQGGNGFAVYFPIKVDNKVTGYINGVFRLEKLISRCFGNTVRDFNYEVILAGQRVFLRGEAHNFEAPLLAGRHNFNILGQAWELQIVPGSTKGDTAKSLYYLALSVVLSLAVLVAFITRSRLISKEKLTRALSTAEESEIKFRTIFDKSPACLLRFNQKGLFTDWNRAAASIFNFEFPPNTRRNAFDLKGLTPLIPAIKKALAGQVSNYTGFIEIQSKKVEIDAVIETLLSGEDRIQGGIILLEDVTAQNETMRAREVMFEIGELTNDIKELPQLFKAIQISLGKVLDTRNFYVALVDEETGNLSFPYYVDEFDSPFPEPRKDERGLSAFVLNTGVPIILNKEEIHALNREGKIDLLGTPSEQWLGSPLMVKGKPIGVMAVQSYSADTIFDGNDMGMMNFVSDQIAITIKINIEDEKLRQSEAMHRQLSTKLNDSNNIKALLLDIITHDLKNPAGVISSVADMLVMEDEVSEEVMLIKDSSDALLKVIENTTALARITLGEKIAMEQIDLSQLAVNITGEFLSSFSGQGKPLEINIDQDLVCEANPIIAEVFRNYLSNALKYAPQGKKVIFNLKDNDDEIEFSVSDLGNSILGEDQTNIFERTVQLANGKSRGSGLGLAIVKRIAAVHGAAVGIYSNEPTGNVFYMRLPKLSKARTEII
ncbi:MAG: ATP-binding protein [Candidatus Marinimicrobia bacterium]|nr:ATP-binding protein [Candidatus Neomarinimicrobiota bacterium]